MACRHVGAGVLCHGLYIVAFYLFLLVIEGHFVPVADTMSGMEKNRFVSLCGRQASSVLCRVRELLF